MLLFLYSQKGDDLFHPTGKEKQRYTYACALKLGSQVLVRMRIPFLFPCPCGALSERVSNRNPL